MILDYLTLPGIVVGCSMVMVGTATLVYAWLEWAEDRGVWL